MVRTAARLLGAGAPGQSGAPQGQDRPWSGHEEGAASQRGVGGSDVPHRRGPAGSGLGLSERDLCSQHRHLGPRQPGSPVCSPGPPPLVKEALATYNSGNNVREAQATC